MKCLNKSEFYISQITIEGCELDMVKAFEEKYFCKLDYKILDRIIIKIKNKMEYTRLHSYLKCNSIHYEVIRIKGDKELIHSDFHHMIEA